MPFIALPFACFIPFTKYTGIVNLFIILSGLKELTRQMIVQDRIFFIPVTLGH